MSTWNRTSGHGSSGTSRWKSERVRGAVSVDGVGRAVLICLVAGLLLGAHAWTRVEATMVGYRLSSAQAEQDELLREKRELELELATRRAAARLDVDARKRLGMVPPAPDRIIALPAKGPEAPAFAEVGAQR